MTYAAAKNKAESGYGLAAAKNDIMVNRGSHSCKDYAIEQLTHGRHDKLGAGVSESWHIIANTLQTQAM